MEFKLMKFGKILFALALAGFLGLTTSAEAASLNGSIGFDARDFTVDGVTNGDITTGTLYTFATIPGGPNTQATTADPTGSFAGVPPGTIILSSALDLGAAGGTG